MQLRSKQTGLGMIQWAAIIAVAGVLGLSAYRLIPVYVDNMTIRTILKNAAADPESGTKSPSELRKSMVGAFISNRVDEKILKDIKIKNEGNMLVMDARYETRVPLMYNIDAVVHFDDMIFEIPKR